MTKTELMETVKNYNLWEAKVYPLYHCQAAIIVPEESNRIYLLRSYQTIVAIASVDTKTVYPFYWYSQTTCQHVSKFQGWLSNNELWKKVPIYDASCYRVGELRAHISCDWADLLKGVVL